MESKEEVKDAIEGGEEKEEEEEEPYEAKLKEEENEEEELLLRHRCYLKEKISEIFPQLSDDTLNTTILDYRNRNNLHLCIEDLLNNKETQDLEESSPSSRDGPRIDCPDGSCGEVDEQVLRIVMIGETGSGKSSTGNTVLGKDVFKSSASASSVTKNCQEARNFRFGQQILVIDTPRMFDTDVPTEQILQELSKCISLSLPGPHVFLLVLRVGRFTAEEYDTVKHIAQVFGEDVFEHMVLLFTGKDSLEAGGESFDEFLKTIPTALEKIITKCNKRCITINNSSKNDIDARNIMERINELVESHNGRHYTNEMFQEAEMKCGEIVEKMRRQIDKDKQKETYEMKQKLNKKFQKQIDSLKAIQDELEQKIRDLERQKEAEEKQKQEDKIRKCREEMKNIKHQLDDCLQQRDGDLTKDLKSLENKYLNELIAITQAPKAEAVFTIIKGATTVGWC